MKNKFFFIKTNIANVKKFYRRDFEENFLKIFFQNLKFVVFIYFYFCIYQFCLSSF